jgi:site-specific DNA-methyltransferase (adenine-specific)
LSKVNLIHSDCISAMKSLPENSVDSIVTDPPYELGFMGKSWDNSGIANSVEMWSEVLRVLKPGGHLLAFSGSRTYHRMVCAIEDAGFEIRDQIMWVYGSGFPKSLDISKAIDKQANVEREIVASYETHDIRNAGLMDKKGGVTVNKTAPNTDLAKKWDGWGTALKPAHEPIVMARKPLIGTVANNVSVFGVGGINIDDSRVLSNEKTKSEGHFRKGNVIGDERTSVGAGQFGDGAWVAGTDLSQGRWPANFIHDNSDEVVALFPDTKGKTGMNQQASSRGLYEGGESFGDTKINDGITDTGSAARFFYCAKASKRDRNEGLDAFDTKEIAGKGNGLARKCTTCFASVIDGCDCPDRTFVNPSRANHHPTVKPTSLMQYLVRLVTPKDGVVLDPFMGSGSTGKACVYEDFNFIGIDQDLDYVGIAQARIQFAQESKDSKLPLF